MRIVWRVGMIFMALLLTTGVARAERRRLAFLAVAPAVEQAAAIALSPWDIEIVPVPDRVSSSAMDLATKDARGIADRDRADAVAWLDEHEGSRTLWLYDVHDDQVVTRQVATGEIDDATAASIALSLKTLLRSSTVAPPHERLGGRAESRERGPGVIRLEIDGGTRLRVSEQTFFAPRLGVAVSFWPRPFGERLGIALRLEEGLGLPVRANELMARYYDHTPSLSVRARIPLGSTFSLEPAVGGALHVTVLSGGSIDGRPAVDVTRVNPSLEGSLGALVNVAPWAFLGVRVGASYWGTWQRYLVENCPVLTIPPLQGSVGLVIGGSLN